MGASHTLAMHFFWSENILWKEDLEGRDVTVNLSGKYLIVDIEFISKYIASKNASWTDSSSFLIDLENVLLVQVNGKAVQVCVSSMDSTTDDEGNLARDAWKQRPWKGKGINMLWFKSQDHAQVFDSPVTRRPLLSAIKAYCAEGVELTAMVPGLVNTRAKA